MRIIENDSTTKSSANTAPFGLGSDAMEQVVAATRGTRIAKTERRISIERDEWTTNRGKKSDDPAEYVSVVHTTAETRQNTCILIM